MPGVFHKTEGQWRLARVDASPSLLRFAPVSISPSGALRPHNCADACLLVRVDAGRKWAALVFCDVAILHNGTPITAGLRLLEHRDALALESHEALFFSTEELAHVETFAAEAAAVSCPRCRSDVRPGDTVVRCPACSVVHHESPDRNCWSYAETCALCSQPTALNAGLRWTPEEL